jgi:transcriptional regulator with XRE-family HTH domain
MARRGPAGKPQLLHPPRRLRYLRRAQGVTLADVAERIGVTEATAEAWERRQRDIPDDQKVRLAAIFGVTVAFLMGWDDQDQPDVDG